MGRLPDFRLRVTVREQKVGRGTTKGLTRKSEPEETRSRPYLLPPPPRMGIACGKPLWKPDLPPPPGWK